MTTKTSPLGVGDRIRELRKWLRISQLALGEYLGVPRSAISAIESGSRELSAVELLKLSRFFRCDPNSMLGLTKTPVDYVGLSFKPRQNSAAVDLDEHDYREMARFSEFLKERQRSTPKKRRPPESLIKSKVPQIAAAELHKKLNLKVPVDIYSVIESIGLYPRFSALIGLAGAIVRTRSETDEDEVFGILINSDQPEERTRFSAAHEVGHYLLDHLKNVESHASHKTAWRSPIESDADTFAAELLVPSDDLAKLAGANRNLSPELVLSFADKFVVSYQAMLRRLLDIGAISKVQFNEFSTQKPSLLRRSVPKLNSAKRKGFDPKTIEKWVRESARTQNEEFVNSPDWIRFIQEAACFQYLKGHGVEERAEEVKEVYEKVALWISAEFPIGAR